MSKTFEEMRKGNVDEISIKDLTKKIAKSTGTQGIQKAMGKSKEKTRADLAAMRKRLNAGVEHGATSNHPVNEYLTAAEKKLMAQMYDKKGNLTPLGKKVMDHGKKNEEVELDEIANKFAVVSVKSGNVLAFASDEKDAISLSKKEKGKVVKLKLRDQVGPKSAREMIGKPLEDLTTARKGRGWVRNEDAQLDEMTSAQKNKFDKLYKKMHGGPEHKAMKQKINNPVKADDAFHALVKRKAMEGTNLDERKIKKGDAVIALSGPHKGDRHEVIHDFGNGKYNIKPVAKNGGGLLPRQIKYRLGAAGAKASELKLIEEVEVLGEASKTIQSMMQIVDKKQAMKIDGVLVDMFTASAVTQIYNKLNDANKAKMDKMKATQLANVAMKLLKKEDVQEATGSFEYYYSDGTGVVSAVGNKGDMRKMNIKQAKAGKKGGSFSPNHKKYKVGDKIKEDLDEVSRSTVRTHFSARYNDKEVKMGIGIASDKRYANNMTGASKAIEKIKKGLSDHPQIKAVLKRMNETQLTFKEMREMKSVVREVSPELYNRAVAKRKYKQDRAANSSAANSMVGNKAQAAKDKATSQKHGTKLAKMRAMGVNKAARSLNLLRKESVEEGLKKSPEGTIRIIDLGRQNNPEVRKHLNLPDDKKGYQVQRMTKGIFVNQGKPYKSMKDAEKVKKTGQHSLQMEKAPKIDPQKMAAHMAKYNKPKKQTNTQKQLSSIRQRADRMALRQSKPES